MKRKQLRAFNNSYRPTCIAVEYPFTSFKTTEVHITSELVELSNEGLPNPVGKTDGLGITTTINSAPRSPTIDSTSLSPKVRTSSKTASSRRTDLQRRNNRAAMEANTAAWSYTKCAILFFISLLVTWVPSSINRVYSLIYPEVVSVPFTYASAVVLPLMGFWNSVIYITTSWGACKTLFGRACGDVTQKATTARRLSRTRIGSRKSRADSTSDSVRALAIPYQS